MRDGAVLKRAGIFPGSVFDMQDGVGNRSVIELAKGPAEIGIGVVEQFKRPFAERARSFKGEVALVTEAQLEHSGVVLGTAGGDRLDGDVVFNEASVIRR